MKPEISTFHAGAEAPDSVDLHRHTHSVQFYSDDAFLIAVLSRFMGSAIGAGDAAVVIATAAHRDALAARLADRGLDIARAVEQGRYVALDAAETLSHFLVNGWPDEARFVELIGGVISRAKIAARNEHGRAALFGEMVALLWQDGKTEAALRLEQLWNEIAQSHSFSLVCAYPFAGFYRQADAELFQQICAQHSVVVPDEHYTLAREEQRLRNVAGWQQKALALEAEAGKRKQAEIDARKLAAIVESSDDAIASKDLNGIISSWNAAAERMFGYTAEEMIGQPIKKIIPPELHSDEDYILERIRSGQRIDHFETVRLTKSGERIDVSLTVSPIKDDAGRVIGAAKIARDITERKRTEQALRRAEKLALTGRMALTIAHEINNPLEGVINALFLMRTHVQGDAGRRYLAIAESELDRVAHITKQTLAFYRERLTPEPVDLREMMDSVLSVLSKKIAQKRVMLVRRDQPLVITGLKGELRQLFSNLVDNALDAVGANGRIEIDIAADGVNAVVSVSDNGPGINPDHLPKLFEPFFTTKVHLGTGLGLWVAQEIAEKHGGKIEAESRTDGADHGTTFRVTLAGVRDANANATTAA
jgi:PAS domain S-box-containing protein